MASRRAGSLSAEDRVVAEQAAERNADLAVGNGNAPILVEPQDDASSSADSSSAASSSGVNIIDAHQAQEAPFAHVESIKDGGSLAIHPSTHRTVTKTTTASSIACDSEIDPNALLPPPRPWYRRLNPLRWGRMPPVPAQRTISPEYGASFLSKLFFAWMTPLMSTGYQRPLQANDIWLVNPDRDMDHLATRMTDAFEWRLSRGSKRPLLGAMYDTVRNEFLLGGACALLFSVLQVLAPFTLRYLITFAQQAYAVSQGLSTEGPPIGTGLGLVFGISVMQVLQSLGTSHFIYRGFIVGAQLRAALISMIFAKAMRISGRAKAGMPAGIPVDTVNKTHDKSNGAATDALSEKAQRDELLKTKRSLLEKIRHPSKEKTDATPKRPVAATEGWSNGRIVNLMSVDTFRVYEGSSMFHMAWSSPAAATITLALLLVNLTYSALAGFAFIVIGMPLLTRAIKKLLSRRRAINKITDQRVSLTQEVLQSIRFVKFFGWETSFLERINALRKREIGAVQVVLTIRNAILAVSMSMPVLASMLSFVTYSLTQHALNPAPIFSSLALFNALRMPLNLLPTVLGQVTDAYVAVGRIQEFLLAEEQPDDIIWDTENKQAVIISDATFTWEHVQANETSPTAAKSKQSKQQTAASRADTRWKRMSRGVFRKKNATTAPQLNEKSAEDDIAQPFELQDINVSIGRQELVAVIGSVGSGKSSLLAALAGDMRCLSGQVTLGASRAFCPQYAWIQNTTLQENILFGQPMKRGWYEKVIDACALRPDIEMLPAGDQTEIGERGITLSGGQKQRLNIARAIYHNADLVLLDDPLSAVDAHVGRHIFDRAISGLLKGKCRVLATHQLHVLKRCDRILWVENGAVRAFDTFPALLEKDETFRNMMALTAQEENEQSPQAAGPGDKAANANGPKKRKSRKAGVLITEEERAVDSLSWRIYAAYVKASGSYFNAPLVVLLLILSQVANIATSLWLSYWTSNVFGYQLGQYIGVYCGLGVLQSLLLFMFSWTVAMMGTRASRVMLHQAVGRVLRAPMSFFDTTPLGRITNRFSKDVDVMDNALTDAIRMFGVTFAMIIAVFILIIVFFHYFAIALGPLAVMFVLSANYYRASAREVKRFEAVKRSVVFARFGEGIAGTASIRAYGMQKQFGQQIRATLDDMDSAYYLTFSNQRWLSVRLDAIGNLLVFVTGILVVTSRFNISPSISGLVLSYILSITQMMQFSVRQLAEVENAMNSTERLHYYGTELPSEAPAHLGPVPEAWPQHGALTFDHVDMRYRPGLPLVLDDLDLTIRGGERIGIVGRTGAGKSSIMAALFRLNELSAGTITIDDIDISKIGLQDLRDRLAIIPQDPTLFKGTVRSNLDPFGRHTDLELWSALRQADLVGVNDGPGASNSKVTALEGSATNKINGNVSSSPALKINEPIKSPLPTGMTAQVRQAIHLDGVVEEEGLNFSLGQRQLMALARALVRNCQVIVCDEATSSVDLETDARIQRTMASAFRGRTLLCIAHRLRTIIGYDRIVVMDQGRVRECDSPKRLWDQRDGVFRSMCDRSGIREQDFEEARRDMEEFQGKI